ncbi:glycerol-3-phosphate responsive antiterminator [Brevibacterium moorei]|uniref:glycerol-3-phosphate responsive antiterminator n=1 Tax=Brevibacterium moorei TaxID=2968457 RepID=UPI00211B831B|nr:glycerol-3-phosphate responsive antiterminator [Brevibacterium sp. 68QC2CO]MCQ9385462.1 glycerol-3-phosphate responsive antiterminator [Brevibacterium sp. 68QC2CO]
MALEQILHDNPVIGTLFGEAGLEEFCAAPTRFSFVANLPLSRLDHVFSRLAEAPTLPLLNVDSVAGLTANADGLDYLKGVGVPGVVSTHSQTVARAAGMGMLAVQKVFVTDRSNLKRAAATVKASHAHFVQLMPWPVVPFVDRDFLEQLGPFIVAGFVRTEDDIRRAFDLGALAVSTSQSELWDFTL